MQLETMSILHFIRKHNRKTKTGATITQEASSKSACFCIRSSTKNIIESFNHWILGKVYKNMAYCEKYTTLFKFKRASSWHVATMEESATANAEFCKFHFIPSVTSWDLCPWLNTGFNWFKLFITPIPSGLPYLQHVLPYWIIIVTIKKNEDFLNLFHQPRKNLEIMIVRSSFERGFFWFCSVNVCIEAWES